MGAIFFVRLFLILAGFLFRRVGGDWIGGGGEHLGALSQPSKKRGCGKPCVIDCGLTVAPRAVARRQHQPRGG